MMKRLAIAFACLVSCEGSVPVARADGPFSKVTAFVALRASPPEITGELWLDRDTVEAKFPIDKDGDTNYTEGELYAVRGPLTDYVNQHLHLLWGGQKHPIALQDMVFDRRPGAKNISVKMVFTVPKFSEGSSLLIFSTMLSDLSRQGRTMVSIDMGGRREVCVLGPDLYYDQRSSASSGDRSATQPAASPAGAAKPRYGCVNLCLAVESARATNRCPRCGSELAPLSGGPMPGKGYIGRLGGTLMPFVPGQYRLEGLLATPEEFRVYLLSDELDATPVGPLAGSVQIWTDKMENTTMHREDLKISNDGAYLWSSVPKGMVLPLRARCMIQMGDGKGQRMVDFYLPHVVPVEQ